MPDSFFSVFDRQKGRKQATKETVPKGKSGGLSGKNSKSPPRTDKSFLAYHEHVTKNKQAP